MQNTTRKALKYKDTKLLIINFILKHKKIILTLILIILYALFYFLIDFSTQSLVAHDEGLYARRSRLVEESYNWFSSPFSTPHHKTLGSYWFTALSIRLFGNNELALRLPSILSSFLCLLISYLIAIKISNKKSALISIFALSSMPLWIQYSRYASPDIPFVLCILLSILFFLKFLDSNKYRYIYVFISGLFISISFFIRSYMVFVPIIGLSPFLAFNLYRTKNSLKILFLNGILFGSIPTFLNLYFSYKKFGISGITSLFEFAKKQAVGGFDFNNLVLIPLNYLYFTFPIGILFFIFIAFTRSKNKVKYPLLTYFYPFLSLLVLLCMSRSYPHYYLFLLPSLSILFAVQLQSCSFRFPTSEKVIKSLLLLLMIFVVVILISLAFYFNAILIDYSYRKILLVYILPLFLSLSIISSSRYLFIAKDNNFNLIKFFYNITIPQYIFLSLLYNLGVIGNPNYKTKSFINDKYVSSIINSNTIYLYKVDTKVKTLLSFYLPSSIVVKSSGDLKMFNYIITSDKNLLHSYKNDSVFRSIKKFDNHFLLMNISK